MLFLLFSIMFIESFPAMQDREKCGEERGRKDIEAPHVRSELERFFLSLDTEERPVTMYLYLLEKFFILLERFLLESREERKILIIRMIADMMQDGMITGAEIKKKMEEAKDFGDDIADIEELFEKSCLILSGEMERYINTLFEEAVSNLNAVSEIIKEIEKSIGALSRTPFVRESVLSSYQQRLENIKRFASTQQ